MDRRTFEGPMDWEYQNRGPFDPTSPFAQAAQSGGLQHGFASPTRPSASSRPNPFATPSKPQPNRPLFTPQNNSAKPPAPPFRNPSFTTPRKPFDEVVLSEASGAEDSPARTEASDLPNDTPEADRMSDVFVSGAITPGKVDKSHRYQKGGLSARKHASGKGDIRPYRDFGASDLGRRRRRRDRNIHMQRHYQDWDEDSDDSLYDRSRYRSRHKKSNAPPRNGGVIGSIFHMMEEHHTAPENLHRWIQLGINIFLGGIFCVAIFSVVHAVHADIVAVNELARQEIRTDIARCQDLYLSNGCATTDAPAFKALCTEWYECMSQDPERIVRVRTTLKEVAHIMNDFFGNLNLKAWGAFMAVLVCTLFANNALGWKPANNAAPHPPPGPHPSHGWGGPVEDSPWVPMHTPKMQRHALLGDDTDTDGTPPRLQLRSPSKRNRSMSPIKYAR